MLTRLLSGVCLKYHFMYIQECIPVGCVLSAAVAICPGGVVPALTPRLLNKNAFQ